MNRVILIALILCIWTNLFAHIDVKNFQKLNFSNLILEKDLKNGSQNSLFDNTNHCQVKQFSSNKYSGFCLLKYPIVGNEKCINGCISNKNVSAGKYWSWGEFLGYGDFTKNLQKKFSDNLLFGFMEFICVLSFVF